MIREMYSYQSLETRSVDNPNPCDELNFQKQNFPYLEESL